MMTPRLTRYVVHSRCSAAESLVNEGKHLLLIATTHDNLDDLRREEMANMGIARLIEAVAHLSAIANEFSVMSVCEVKDD